MLHLQDILVLSLCLTIHYYYRHYHRRAQFPLPPGPKRWPLVGNAFSTPTSFAYKYYGMMAKKLGEVPESFKLFNVQGKS